jgi:RecB family exonuclease
LEKSVVLDVVFYQTNQDLLKKMSEDKPPLIICPSPQVADNLRSLAPDLEIITISKWTSNHLKKMGLSRVRKSELMIKLSAVWRHYFPAGSTSVFLEAFELFTELRSYTLNMELLNEFLQELDEEVRKSIHIFWLYLDQEKIIDEHLSYNKVTESKFNSAMWFVGFKHMSGVQIDMIKTLSENCEIEVLFPRPVYLDSLPNDWIRWLSTEEEGLRPIEGKSNSTVKVGLIPKGKANIVLNSFFETHPGFDLIMGGTQVGLVTYQEAQRKNSFFKTTEDLFAIDLELLMRELRLQLKEKKTLTVEEIVQFFIDEKILTVEKGEYRKYKILELFGLAVEAYAEFQKIIDGFALDIMEIIVGLNSPRVSFLSLEEKATRSFIDMNGLNFRDEKRSIALLATQSMGGFRSNERILSEAMTRALRVIGPIKRAGLDFLFHKYELLSILSDSKNILLIEEQIVETDLSWREVLKHFDVVDYDLGIRYSIKKPQEYLNPKKRNGPFLQSYFSASRLQAFIDCPQKYYFNYIEKIDNRPNERSSLGPDELGNLEHKIIAQYFEENSFKKDAAINLEKHRKICLRIFNEYLSESKLNLNETEKARGYNEIMHYTWNGIIFLLDLMESKSVKSIRFEVSLGDNPWLMKGSIDCLIELGDKKVILIDFKRSSSATGTKTETMELRKIQLWVYLLIMMEAGYSIESFGYLNLSDLSDDKLFFYEDDAQKVITNLMDEAKAVIEGSISALKTETSFTPKPREAKVCNYCPVNLFCLKGECA